MWETDDSDCSWSDHLSFSHVYLLWHIELFYMLYWIFVANMLILLLILLLKWWFSTMQIACIALLKFAHDSTSCLRSLQKSRLLMRIKTKLIYNLKRGFERILNLHLLLLLLLLKHWEIPLFENLTFINSTIGVEISGGSNVQSF